MHNKILIDNFKCFSEETILNLGQINICLGANSVGKSSVIQSFILVRQIYERASALKDEKSRPITVQLNDVYGLQLGDSERIKSSKTRDDIIIGIDNNIFSMLSNDENPLEMDIEPHFSISELESEQGIFSPNFYYLNAERLGPRNYQIIDSKSINNCGVHGENTIHYLSKKSSDKVDESRCFSLDESKKINLVSKQVEYWMDYIIPGINIKVDEITDLRLSKIQFQQTTIDTEFLSPYNLGFGISYVLPIIVTGLTARKNSMFLVENPEAHLHPKGQSHIGYFLAMMAFSGVQIVIETHSEHVLNGIRIAALKAHKKPTDISINFFSITHNGSSFKHNVDSVSLNDRMDIQSWPEGFMDQEEIDLRTLRELRRK